MKRGGVYVLTDYGEGENLNYKCNFILKTDFQIGDYRIKGTPTYMDPKQFQIFRESKFHHDLWDFIQKNKATNLDLFKADIFSLGATFFKLATGILDVSFLNR